MTVRLAFQVSPSEEDILYRGAQVIRAEADALHLLSDSLDDSFVLACETIVAAAGRVVVTGMGKSGHIARKWAATMAATGTPAIYVHPAEAAHGDLGMLVASDVLIVLSNSGNTGELRPFLRYAASIGVKVIGVASQPDSLVMQCADVKLPIPAVREACPVNIAPTTSTTLQLALGDALAIAIMEIRGFSIEGMKALHPGGSLGLRLTPVREIMHGSRGMPLVEEGTPMREVIIKMTSNGFGIAGVVEKTGRLAGVITDGDVRRHFEELGTANADQVMSTNPKTIASDVMAGDALQFLHENNITAAFVIEHNAPVNTNVPIGIVHIHDFLRIGL